ncbi:MAG TPA: hypothetical protein VES00_00720 [Burkholderiaceae bacterium]|jgi:hypothetical protein|nr:hypothetical protein [Burkholderiaceae bacterium]
MAKPNYAYEKRQRELEKKQKKEDKALRKAAGAQAGSQDGDAPSEPEVPASAGADKSAD